MTASTPGCGTAAASAPGSHVESWIRVSASWRGRRLRLRPGEAAAQVCIAASTYAASGGVGGLEHGDHARQAAAIDRTEESATTTSLSRSTVVGRKARAPNQ